MAEKKKIPCRVCGKLFEPCSYCQSNNGIFRWRNFACSRECAAKYMNDTIAYRESLKHKDEQTVKNIETVQNNIADSNNKNTEVKRKYTKKVTAENVKNDLTE